MPIGKESYPEFAVLSKAVYQEKIDDFILYEIEAKKNPLLVYKLSNEKIAALTEYLMTIRTL